MIKVLSVVISIGCVLSLVTAPLALLYLLWNIDLFGWIVMENLNLPIQWQSVMRWQWYSLWLATVLYSCICWAGVFYLLRVFSGFSSGELINLTSSKNLKRFSVLLFAQAIAKPMLFVLSSLLLSANHPDGQKMLSLSFGSNEVLWIAFALVFWVVSSSMVEAHRIQSENEQFV
jgi:hypothetical protein